MPFCRVAGPPRLSVGFPRHGSRIGSLGLAEWPSGLGKGLQSPVHGFDSRLRLAGGWRSGARCLDTVATSEPIAAGKRPVPKKTS
jgi:hypothetical protein